MHTIHASQRRVCNNYSELSDLLEVKKNQKIHLFKIFI